MVINSFLVFLLFSLNIKSDVFISLVYISPKASSKTAGVSRQFPLNGSQSYGRSKTHRYNLVDEYNKQIRSWRRRLQAIRTPPLSGSSSWLSQGSRYSASVVVYHSSRSQSHSGIKFTGKRVRPENDDLACFGGCVG